MIQTDGAQSADKLKKTEHQKIAGILQYIQDTFGFSDGVYLVGYKGDDPHFYGFSVGYSKRLIDVRILLEKLAGECLV